MCSHEWEKIGECQVCMRCGITKLPDGRIYFDRDIPNYKPEKRKKGKRNGKK